MNNQEETIKCPYCNEDIKKVAKKCKHCQEWIEDRDQERKNPIADGVQKAEYRENISDLVFLIYLGGGGLLGYQLMRTGIVEGYWIIIATAILFLIVALIISNLSEATLGFLGILGSAIGGYFVWTYFGAGWGIGAIMVIFIAITGTKELKETLDAYQ